MFMTKTQKYMMKAETKQNTGMPKVCKGMLYVGHTFITHKPCKNGKN